MMIVSCGAGTNSTAVLVGLHERGIIPDAILFADTGGEKPHTYAHIKDLQVWLKRISFPEVTIVKKVDLNGDVLTLEQDCINKKNLPSVAYGGFKSCSQKYKMQPQEKWVNNWEPAKAIWKQGKKITKVIGFDAGEPHRAKDYSCKKYENWYPLLDWDWGRDECVEAIARAGLSQPNKSSCFFCPNNRPSEIREMNAVYPDLVQRAIAMEKNADLTTIKGLGRSGYAWSQVIATDEMFPYPQHEMPCGCGE